jgi:hypothetical protein
MFENADLIHRYSRADAIRDGELVDVSATAREARIRYPVALTRAVWERCVVEYAAATDVRLHRRAPSCGRIRLFGLVSVFDRDRVTLAGPTSATFCRQTSMSSRFCLWYSGPNVSVKLEGGATSITGIV